MDFRHLNKNQLEAATEYIERPLIIFAGPGSGKTLTLTLRIVYFLNRGIAGSSILALTFTKKAVLEMRRQLSKNLPKHERVEDLSILTFHKLGVKILRANAGRANLRYNFEIYSGKKQRVLLEQSLREYLKFNKIDDLWEGDIEPLTDEQIGMIGDDGDSYDRNSTEFPQNALKSINGVIARTKVDPSYTNKLNKCFKHLISIYTNKLRTNNAIDLPDILCLTGQLFKEHPDVLEKYQNKYRYVVVDEFQDTNNIQIELLRLLGMYSCVTVCGDDDQAIYGWRGASNDIFRQFQISFPRYAEVVLNENYRSTQHIVNASQGLIKSNQNRRAKTIFTNNQIGSKLSRVLSDSTRSEGRDIASLIKHYATLYRLKYSDMAILYRMHRVCKDMVIALDHMSIPYTMSKKKSPVQFDKNAKAILNYIKIGINSKDDSAFLEIYNCPKRGIGVKALKKLQTIACIRECSLYEACVFLTKTLKGKQKENFTDLKNAIAFAVNSVNEHPPKSSVSLLSSKLNIQGGMVYYLENMSRTHNVPGLDSHFKFLESFGEDTDVTSDSVTLSTIHQAKGQEWKCVFLIGMVEGVLPSSFRENIEEERRLAYVACTRSRDFLILSAPQTDSIGNLLYPSRFLDEISADSIV